MKSNKGISMITLVITVICIILILGIAYRTGYRYISKSKEEERTALVSIMSDAVVRRQNDRYSGLGDNAYYVGYHVGSGDFENLLQKFDASYLYEPGLWYVLDSKKAKDLGVVDADKYIVKDLNDDAENKKDKYVAVVDYFTGEVEIIKYQDYKALIDKVVSDSDASGCDHIYVVATCTEPSVCIKCGDILTHALGHNYDIEEATCTEDKKCSRCGYIAEKAKGHEYDITTLSYNNEGHFNKCIRYDSCGAVGNFNYHDKKITALATNEWIHVVECVADGCNWADDSEACTTKIRTKDINYHIKYCTKCLKEQEESHEHYLEYEYLDEDEHMVQCKGCESDLYKEIHVDVEAPYGVCDKCGGITNMSEAPVVDVLKMKNISSDAEDAYVAKKGDVIQITLKITIMLSNPPTIKLQGVVIKPESIIRQEDMLTWSVDVKTSSYPLPDGVMSIEVSNIKSLWGIAGSNVSETTDSKYVRYDSTKPEYIYIPE